MLHRTCAARRKLLSENPMPKPECTSMYGMYQLIIASVQRNETGADHILRPKTSSPIFSKLPRIKVRPIFRMARV